MADQTMKGLVLLADAKASERRCVANRLTRSGDGSYGDVIPAGRHGIEVMRRVTPSRWVENAVGTFVKAAFVTERQAQSLFQALRSRVTSGNPRTVSLGHSQRGQRAEVR